MVHLTSPQSWPYFQKALTFSGQVRIKLLKVIKLFKSNLFQSFWTLSKAPIGLPYKTTEEATPFYEKIIKNLSCCKDGDCSMADLSCLRAKTTKELQKAAWNLGEMRPENFPGKVGCFSDRFEAKS